MNLRKMKKQFKQDYGFLLSDHNQAHFIRQTGKLYQHDAPKFPHYKWAKIKYHEIKTNVLR